MDIVKVMLADDHAVLRASYRFLLESTGRFWVVAEAGSGEEACATYASCRPDVVIMDLSMPGMGGMPAIRKLREMDPSARILVCSVHEEPALRARALAQGASAYITKCEIADRLLEILEQIMDMSPDKPGNQ